MANNHHHHHHHNQHQHHHHHSEAPADDFLEHLLGIPPYATSSSDVGLSGGPHEHHNMMMGLQLSSGADGSGQHQGFHGSGFPLGLSLDQGKPGGFLKLDETSGSVKRFMENGVDGRSAPGVKNTFHAQPMQNNNNMPAAPQPPTMRPRVRARRGQATDPHSIAERLRREKIAERIRGLQELVPSVNKTDRAAMLDEIVDYVKFLRLQVKVLSMSRLGGAGAVAPLVTDIPLSSVEEESGEEGRNQPAWEKWSSDGTEQQVAKLMEENVGAAMQFLQSKALCIMPISLASVIYHTPQPDTSALVKSERNPPS